MSKQKIQEPFLAKKILSQLFNVTKTWYSDFFRKTFVQRLDSAEITQTCDHLGLIYAFIYWKHQKPK